jgi:hypothetical protein
MQKRKKKHFASAEKLKVKLGESVRAGEKLLLHSAAKIVLVTSDILNYVFFMSLQVVAEELVHGLRWHQC